MKSYRKELWFNVPSHNGSATSVGRQIQNRERSDRVALNDIHSALITPGLHFLLVHA